MITKLIRFDWAIKNLLRNKANFGILEGFLSELLGEKIKIHRILESEGNSEYKRAKYNRVDILVEDADGEMIIVEVQNDTELDFFHRILYGTSKLITEYLDLGQSYSQIKKVISVSIVYFNLGRGKDYIYKGCTTFHGIHQQDELGLSPKQKKLFKKETVQEIYPEYYVIKPTQFGEKIKNTLDEWIYFLKNSEVKKEFTAKGIQEAKQKLHIMQLSRKEQKQYKRYLEDLSYEASISETVHFEAKEMVRELKAILEEKGRKKGLQEGIKEGIKEGRKVRELEIARNMKSAGVPINQIVLFTGLNREDIEQL